MSGWEDVTPDSDAGFDPTGGAATPDYPTPPVPSAQPTTDSPFGGVQAVDGLVYAAQDTSPELNWRPSDHTIPAPPVRERPAPRRFQRAEPWKPGPDPVPDGVRRSRSRMTRMLVLSIIPIAVLLGLGYLVWTFMKAYGL